MPTFKLADLQVQESHSKSSEEGFEMLIAKMGDTKYNYEEDTHTRSMIPTHSDIEPSQDVAGYQQNYMAYLTRCWADHYGVVVEPNHLWYTLLCELAVKVKADPETYRPIFTTSQEKQTIIVPYNGGSYVMNMDMLLTELEKHVPTDTAAFFPEFSTNNYRNRMAKYAAFADMASPYYDYIMLMCGFPSIDVQGSRDDWNLMASKWGGLSKVFRPHSKWFARVQSVLNNCVKNFESPEWWKGIYANKRCGSGSNVLVSGWYADLFYEKCSMPKLENFPACVSTVEYTSVNLHGTDDVKVFRMKQGLFTYRLEDQTLIPNFGFILYNVADEPFIFQPEMHPAMVTSIDNYTSHQFASVRHRLEPEHMVNSSKMNAKAREAVQKTRAEAPEKLGWYRETAI